MYTLKEILNMPYKEGRKFKLSNDDAIYYVDKHGILRWQASEAELEQYGDNIMPITKNIFDYKFEVIKPYIPFQEAFTEWHKNNRTIYCDCFDGTILCYDGEKKEGFGGYLFHPEEIANGKWYLGNIS